MQSVSPAETARQIKREGKRHGLYPVIRGDKCFVAQKERVVVDGPLFSTISTDDSVISSVTMQHPLSNVWKSRKQREEFNSAEVYRAAARRRKLAEKRGMDERYGDRIRELKRIERNIGADEMKAIFEEARAKGLITMGRN